MTLLPCPLCTPRDETLVWQDSCCRVILVEDPDYPGFCRVIWHDHVAEMSDLVPLEQQHLMGVVLATERALRALMKPEKINLASLGNQVPHLHWHVIPRFREDAHFPEAIWGTRQRATRPGQAPDREILASWIESIMGHPGKPAGSATV
ncbi:HIT family protein [Ectothiorhodospira lacustris]|uniref:HIT family protein n=1 Tax=Ectothiorhodospira lacustris TaxID=2899127 RepID=UPI001EE8AB6C|nr:HIT family protein [Ectothiorhodospira lacustris]MCG5501628.1 HIT family protein [Ectothiorhodospira lacustris]MCG5510731.1 HIT family protein [Ectothiorhodospira lacustris]MCG5522463.1 HIT family protein [Ectothiorhodospira lacustris]